MRLFPAHFTSATYLNRLDLNMKQPLVHKYHTNSFNCESFISVRVPAALDLIRQKFYSFACWKLRSNPRNVFFIISDRLKVEIFPVPDIAHQSALAWLEVSF